jgi:opacity protein-like surface antigen
LEALLISSDFSYNVGAGIDYQVKDDFWPTLGYFYDYFGKNKVGTVYANNTFIPVGTLENANLHSNSAFLSARYFFCDLGEYYNYIKVLHF